MCKVTKRKWHGKFNATKLVLKIDMRKKNLITFFTPEEKIVNLRWSTRVSKLFFNKLQLGFQCSCTIGWKASIFGVCGSPNAGKYGPENSEYGHFSYSAILGKMTRKMKDRKSGCIANDFESICFARMGYM